MTKSLVNFDANATYGPLEGMGSVLSDAYYAAWNPSSVHRGGQKARAMIEEARESVRELVGAQRKDKIVFTSGATEGDNVAMLQTHFGRSDKKEIVITAIEHPAVSAPAKFLEQFGFTVHTVKTDAKGEISPDAVAAVCSEKTGLVSVMIANNETGYLLPLKEIIRKVRAKAPQALFHTDAVQVVGKCEFNFTELGVDFVTASGHKMGSAPGVGALIIKDGTPFFPSFIGGTQEERYRGGTENVLGIHLMGVVAKKLHGKLGERIEKMRHTRDRFETLMLEAFPEVQFNYSHTTRIPNTSSMYVPCAISADLVVAIDQYGLCISGGPACFSGKPEPSAGLLAIGQDKDRARETVRVSFRADATDDEINRLVQAFKESVPRVREYNNAS